MSLSFHLRMLAMGRIGGRKGSLCFCPDRKLALHKRVNDRKNYRCGTLTGAIAPAAIGCDSKRIGFGRFGFGGTLGKNGS
jgi:hypothetical protein